MDIKFTNRLSYKQARLTVMVGFILGALLSLVQIGIDYASEDASINREVQALLQISHDPLSRITYNIDAELAQELIGGLLQSPAVIRARLVDNNDTVLADASRSNASPPFTTTPSRAARSRPAISAVGAATRSGHGVATTRTCAKRTGSPEMSQAAPAIASAASVKGTATRSASRMKRPFVPAASSTRATMR